MIHWTEADLQFLNHTVDVMGGRFHHEDGYTEQDRQTMKKLEALAKAGAALTVDGSEQHWKSGLDTFRRIVNAELDHHVPGASQRLLFRAGAALGVKQPDPSRAAREDCGVTRAEHSLIGDWVGAMRLMRCSTCFRLFRA